MTVPPLMDAHKVPGLSIAIVREAKLVWAQGFGVKDRASNAPVDSGTLFEAASMSKPVFAYVVMKLSEKGVLELDTPLSRYTSERFLSGDPRLDRITARHVLSHSSGFQDMRSGDNPLKIHFEPGARWQYSGEGYAYLQSVVTQLTGRVDREACSSYEADLRVCGTDFDSYMRASLLAPFGMDASGYVWADAFAQHLARPHAAAGSPLPVRKSTAAGAARYGAMGGLFTTASDYAKFLIEVIDPEPADAFRLERTTVNEMLRPQVKVEDGPGYAISWALGWRVAQTENGDFVSHGGDQTGYHSTAEISVARMSGYVILTICDSGWKLIKELAPAVSRWVNGGSKG